MATGFTIVLIASVYVLVNYSRLRKMEEGTPEMVRMAAIIRKGAAAFLVTEFRIVAIAVLVLASLGLPGSVAEIAHEGDAVGSRSCLFPIMIIGVSIFISGKITDRLDAAGNTTLANALSSVFIHFSLF